MGAVLRVQEEALMLSNRAKEEEMKRLEYIRLEEERIKKEDKLRAEAMLRAEEERKAKELARQEEIKRQQALMLEQKAETKSTKVEFAGGEERRKEALERRQEFLKQQEDLHMKITSSQFNVGHRPEEEREYGKHSSGN